MSVLAFLMNLMNSSLDLLMPVMLVAGQAQVVVVVGEVVLLEAVIGPSSSPSSAASSSELIPCLLDAYGFFPQNKSFPPIIETTPAS